MRWELKGLHVHVRLFAGKGTLSLGRCGEFVMRVDEWEEFQKNLYRFMQAGSDIEVVPE
jgi:hypothetical protein